MSVIFVFEEEVLNGDYLRFTNSYKPTYVINPAINLKVKHGLYFL